MAEEKKELYIGGLPIIGQPCSKLGWWPVTLLRCHCTIEKGDLTIIVVSGVEQPSVCPRCGRFYKVAGFLPDKTTGVIEPIIVASLPERHDS